MISNSWKKSLIWSTFQQIYSLKFSYMVQFDWRSNHIAWTKPCEMHAFFLNDEKHTGKRHGAKSTKIIIINRIDENGEGINFFMALTMCCSNNGFMRLIGITIQPEIKNNERVRWFWLHVFASITLCFLFLII